MNSTTQTPDMLGASNPFVRGYDNLSIERLILITYANDCPPCFRSIHDSQAHLLDDALELFPCVFNDDAALISEGQSIPDELEECFQSTGLVRQVVYAVTGEMLDERHHVGDLYSLKEAQAMVHRLSFDTGHYSRAWEISTAHLTEEALRYLEYRAGRFNAGATGLLYEPFALRDCNGLGCKLIGTPWTDENLMKIEGSPYTSLRQEQLDAGTPEALVNVLYLAALADVRLLIFDPDAAVLDGLAIYDE
ncbi:ABC transporter substrate-binding protein [Pseudomonas veronii]|uniref:ABC transporter substrate-binding protein n=1 Tax=Pseudomonas veronii TaxID=76761 RepID=A0A7Y0ZY37_PSEVE|nr:MULTISPECIES: ABC transporter substrate-binding protein [Pseudomonas]NMX53068.1 ABC transporter substrate-binding protein [Pseudomonas veronii]NMY00185.1 ABC transporter substrate-binding protein [Pseudomonas veronii]NNA90555.1 ABC transporter substrate-binding protein [Pseudomonas gessardii]QPO20122.1 ABC transporter substrate-binding protein [Pseudomonas sp. Y39-6]URS63284.1 ABC transporter substrate-binding protein [Pseudomonas sp. Y39-6]